MATLEYNGYQGLSNVRINEWRSTPVYEVDGLSHATTEHRLNGTAIVSATTLAAFNTELDLARRLLQRPRGALLIKLDSDTHINFAAGTDDADGPLGNFRVSDPVTPLSSLVTFEVTFWRYELAPAGETQGDVLAHRWTQEWETGKDGMMRHRVAGSLRVLARATATGAAAINTGSNPDAYRQIVVPELPPGFRREVMRFAIDETGNRLLYTIEDKEYGRDLPAPATMARGSFRWARSTGSKLGMIGIKVFECELTAPPEVSPKTLLVSAVEVSKKKINYSGEIRDTIMSIEVTEPDLFNQNKIGYKVVALGTSVNIGEAGQNLKPPNFELYEDLIASAKLGGYADLPVFAHNAIRSLRRKLFAPTDPADSTPGQHLAKVPKAGFEQNDAWEDITVTTAIAPDAVFDDTDPTLDPGDDLAAEGHVKNPYLAYDSIDSIVVEDTGMVLLRANRIGTPDTPVQLRKPTAFLVSEMTAVRLGAPPNRAVRPLPLGAIVKSESWKVSTGNLDANNQRIYSGRFHRVAQFSQTQGAASFFVPQGGLEGPVRFWPGATGIVDMPIDRRITNQQLSNLFAPNPTHPYSFGAVEPYVT